MNRRRNLIPYGRQSISEEDIRSVVRILRSDFLTQGPIIVEFEKSVTEYCRAKYAVAFSSGTAALHGACFAAGISKGDEVITSPMTFAASANCVLYSGGTPIFADIKKDIPLIDTLEILKKITNKTKAIIPVDYSGIPADYNEINSIAHKHKLIVIADAAHSLGATYKNRKVGTLADMTVFSFHPVKLITTGEGGMVVTDSQKFYDRLLLFRNHGISKNPKLLQKKDVGSWYYEMQELGFNYRLTDIHAALGLSQMKKIERFMVKRQKIASFYLDKFKNVPCITLPKVPKDRTSAWHLFPIRANFSKLKKTKKEMFSFFADKGIKLQVHYIPVHLHPYYKKLFGYKKGDFVNAERFYEEEVSLPLYPGLTGRDVAHVIKILKKFSTE